MIFKKNIAKRVNKIIFYLLYFQTIVFVISSCTTSSNKVQMTADNYMQIDDYKQEVFKKYNDIIDDNYNKMFDRIINSGLLKEDERHNFEQTYTKMFFYGLILLTQKKTDIDKQPKKTLEQNKIKKTIISEFNKCDNTANNSIELRLQCYTNVVSNEIIDNNKNNLKKLRTTYLFLEKHDIDDLVESNEIYNEKQELSLLTEQQKKEFKNEITKISDFKAQQACNEHDRYEQKSCNSVNQKFNNSKSFIELVVQFIEQNRILMAKLKAIEKIKENFTKIKDKLHQVGYALELSDYKKKYKKNNFCIKPLYHTSHLNKECINILSGDWTVTTKDKYGYILLNPYNGKFVFLKTKKLYATGDEISVMAFYKGISQFGAITLHVFEELPDEAKKDISEYIFLY